MKDHYYSQHAVALRAELGREVPRDLMRELHRKTPGRHFLVAIRQFLILGVTTWGLVRFTNPFIWIPLAVVQGFTVFNFTVLLHEVVHHTVFARRWPRAERFLALLYSVPSGISGSQFTRWHLDHHAELGSEEDDPKRHHLSPKRNARWFKLLYCTPALFPIYFRAARREAATYPIDLQRRIAIERRLAMGFHLTAIALLSYFFGLPAALRRGRNVANLEDFSVYREGSRIRSIDFNFWGVTFGTKGRFYATLQTRGEQYLVRGDVSARRIEVLRDGVECPSLSPDGTRIAFKKRIGDANWRLSVLDLRTLKEWALAERESVDDQAEWMGNNQVLYGRDAGVWSVRADGRGAPLLLIANALSPAVPRS